MLDKTPIQKELLSPTILFAEFAEFFMQNYATPSRNKYSERVSKRQILDGYLIPMFGSLQVREITNAHIDVFIRRCDDAGVSPKTINNRIAVLSTLLKYAKLRKVIDVVPAWEPVKQEDPGYRFLSVDEVTRLLEAAREQGPFWYAMVSVGVHCGLRNGEIRALRWEDVSLRRQLLTVTQTDWRGVIGKPKSAAGRRTLPLNGSVLAALKAFKPIGSLVFGKPPKGNIIAHETTRNRLARACREAGVKRCGWHTLRHTFASHMVMAGVPLRTVQELMGHATIQMTLRYSHLSPEAKSTATDVLAGLFSKNPNDIKRK